MHGQAFIYEGVLRVEEFENAAVAEQNVLEQQFSLLNKGLPETIVEVGKDDRVRANAFGDAKLEPLSAEVSNQVFGAGIGQHPADLTLQDRRVA